MAKKRSRVGCVAGCLVAVLFGGLALAVVLLVGGGALGAGFFLWSEQESSVTITSVAPAPAPGVDCANEGAATRPAEVVVVPVPAVPVVPATVAVEPAPVAPEPVAVAPEPVAPEPAPEPVAAPKPAPEPVAEAPKPASPKPASPKPASPKPAPASSGSGTSIAVEGGGTVVLIKSGTRYSVPGKVPEGTYEIEATFDGASPVVVGKVTVSADTVTIRCNERMQICRAS